MLFSRFPLHLPNARRTALVLSLALGTLGWLANGAGSTSTSRATGQRIAAITQLTITTNDLIYDPFHQTIYACTPDNAPVNPNSLLIINPATGAVTNTISVGGNPTKLALSDDGQYLYIALRSTGSVRRYDIGSHSLGPEFSLGQVGGNTINAEDIEVVPGLPTSVAISQRVDGSHIGVAVYDNGVPRPNKTGSQPENNLIEFGANSSALYGLNTTFTENGLRKLAVDNNGVSFVHTDHNAVGEFVRDFVFYAGLIYSTTGRVHNPETRQPVGRFPIRSNYSMAIDAPRQRAYYIHTPDDRRLFLSAYDLNTYLEVASLELLNVAGEISGLTLCGPDILAFRDSTKLFLIPISDVVSVPAYPLPTPAIGADGVIKLTLPTNDLIYDPGTQKIYAGLPSSVPGLGNSIMPISPAGFPGTPTFLGSDPGKLAISSDHQYVYAGLSGAGAIRRFNLGSQTAGLQFSLGLSTRGYGPLSVTDLAVQPGNPGVVVATSRNSVVSPPDEGVAVYAEGVKLPIVPTGAFVCSLVEFSDSPSLVYGYGQFNTNFNLIVDSSGISQVSQFAHILYGATDMDFDNGLLYGDNGQVINPETEQLIGAFAASGPVLADSAANRVYFVDHIPGLATLVAFDQQTFLPVGILNIPITGRPASLIQVGTNALAFRTTGNQVFIVPLSSLHPYEIPPPVITVRPDGIRALSLPANDIVYSPHDQMIYASVSSVAGNIGNSLIPFDPQSGLVLPPVFIGSEPDKLAVSITGDKIYAALSGAAAVRGFDVPIRSAGLQFNLGKVDPVGEIRYPDELAVAPGNSNLVAVSTYRLGILGGAGIALFDNGVARPQETGSHSPAFSGSHFYSFSSDSTEFGLRKLAISSAGFTQIKLARNTISGFFVKMSTDGGLIFGGDGAVVDPENLALLGRFNGVDLSHVFLPDAANHRLYTFVRKATAVEVKAYDTTTFLQVGRILIPDIFTQQDGPEGWVQTAIRYGTTGLAFTTTKGVIYLMNAGMIQPLPATPLPTPFQVTSDVKRLRLPAGDLAYNPFDGKIYAGVRSQSEETGPISFGNSIVAIDPNSGAVGQSTFVGSEPSRLRLTADGQYLYVGYWGAESVARMEIATRSVNHRFSLLSPGDSDEPKRVQDLEVSPGGNDTVAIARAKGVAIYDSGVQRPTSADILFSNSVITAIEYSSQSTRLYGLGNQDLHRIDVNNSGATIVGSRQGFVLGEFPQDIRFNGGLIYSVGGQAINPDTMTVVGTYPGGSGVVDGRVIVEADRVYFLKDNHNGTATISAYDRQTFLPAGTMTVPGIGTGGRLVSFIRCGIDCFAFRTGNVQTEFHGTDIFIVRSSGLTGPSTVQFSSANYLAFEFLPSVNITVNRSGDTTSAASITYRTSDNAGLNNCNVVNGNASARCDYSASIGTLNFAPGENSKSFSIPIVDDSYAEGGTETFSIALGDPVNVTVGPQSTTTVRIDADDLTDGPNPIGQTAFFVRQHYIDFLGREPDPGGFQGWQDVINNCPSGNTTCDRIHVSGNFYQSPEFQQRGYFIYRFYPVALGRKPDYAEFIPDLARVSGFLSDAQLEAARVAFVKEFMSRPGFAGTYNALTNTQYVDTLLARAGVTSGNRNFWIAALGNGTRTRAQVLREIAESTEVFNKYFNQAFVVMQYFGYLRRDPDASYLNWIQELDSTGSSRNMINGFVNSLEYRFRFGP